MRPLENMKCVSFYDTKPYDRIFFDQLAKEYGVEFHYFEEKLNKKTATFAEGEAVVAFVNDNLGSDCLKVLYDKGVRVLAMRCSGYNNVDLKYAKGRFHVLRVPAYSPYAVAEYAMGTLLTINRKLHRAYNRTREFNFSLNGLTGFDLRGKTVGVVGTGRIGQAFISICKGFDMRILAYDVYPQELPDVKYVELSEIYRQADVISLHCPLTKDSYHLIDQKAIGMMKEGVFLINTSRGALIDSEALLEGLISRRIGAAALDVYEQETEYFYEDFSNDIIDDDTLARLVSLPNVLVTSHQAFLTKEALYNIATTTMENLKEYFDGKTEFTNEVV